MKAIYECKRVLRTKEIAKKVIKDRTCKKFWSSAFVKTSAILSVPVIEIGYNSLF